MAAPIRVGVCSWADETLTKVWNINAASHPDGWFGISWNELVENTHFEPSVAYGTRYLDALSTLIRNQR